MMKTRLAYLVPSAIFLLIPLVVTNPYYLKILITFGIYSLLAFSLNFIVGYIGEISFGHAAFFGLGAYFSALTMEYLGVNFWVSLVLSLVLTGLVGLFVGFLSLRLKGVHFAICTLAFAEIFRLLILNLGDWTRGAMGISVARPKVPFTDISLGSDLLFYYLVFAVVVIVIAFNRRIFATPFGKAMLAIRESGLLASSIGIHITRSKIAAFVISTIIAALAGVLYAPYIGIITPNMLSVHYTATGLLMVILGGRGYLLGPLYGAFVFTVLPEIFWMSPEMQLVVFGLLLLLCILFMPKGIASLLQLRKLGSIIRAKNGG
jgi:branched-chain amino acid transport system permease protein